MSKRRTDRELEERLRLERERLAFTLRAAGAVAWEWDRSTDRVTVSGDPRQLFRLAERAPIRTSDDFFSRIHPDDLPRVKAAADRAIRGEGDYAEEFRVVRDDGSIMWCLDKGRRFVDEPDGLRLAGIFVDITERKEREEQVRTLNAALAQRAEELQTVLNLRDEESRRKDEFLATLAHELRNPLAPIRMALELVRRRGPITSAQQPALGVIDRQVELLTRLVDDLLDVSRITRGRVELRKERIGLDVIVDRALETTRPALEAAGHAPRVELPAQPLGICGDPMRLSQVLGNLLHNAAKHTPPEGDISIVAERRGGEVLIRVRDEGAGISPEVMPRIFELFAQADTSLERSRGGLGIGLTIAKQLVEMHGGRIAAASEGLGRGSEFTIGLPYQELQPDEAASAEAGASRGEGTERRVLVVDDNEDAADTLAMVLDLAGNEVETAYGPHEALRTSRTFRPQVVFLDIGMPEMSGFDVARRLREQPETREALIVAITGWGQEADRQRAKAAGFDHHLVKPVTAEAVAGILSSGGRASPPSGP